MCVWYLDDTSNDMSKRSSNDKYSLYKGRAMTSLINEKKSPLNLFMSKQMFVFRWYSLLMTLVKLP